MIRFHFAKKESTLRAAGERLAGAGYADVLPGLDDRL